MLNNVVCVENNIKVSKSQTAYFQCDANHEGPYLGKLVWQEREHINTDQAWNMEGSSELASGTLAYQQELTDGSLVSVTVGLWSILMCSHTQLAT